MNDMVTYLDKGFQLIRETVVDDTRRIQSNQDLLETAQVLDNESDDELGEEEDQPLTPEEDMPAFIDDSAKSLESSMNCKDESIQEITKSQAEKVHIENQATLQITEDLRIQRLRKYHPRDRKELRVTMLKKRYQKAKKQAEFKEERLLCREDDEVEEGEPFNYGMYHVD